MRGGKADTNDQKEKDGNVEVKENLEKPTSRDDSVNYEEDSDEKEGENEVDEMNNSNAFKGFNLEKN